MNRSMRARRAGAKPDGATPLLAAGWVWAGRLAGATQSSASARSRVRSIQAPLRRSPARAGPSFEVGALRSEQQPLRRVTPCRGCPIAQDDNAHAVPLTARGERQAAQLLLGSGESRTAAHLLDEPQQPLRVLAARWLRVD